MDRIDNLHKEKIIVYGIGNFYQQKEQALNEQYDIIAYLDRKKEGYYANKKIISLQDISQYTYDKIIIMINSMNECIKVIKYLIVYCDISSDKILLGQDCFHVYYYLDKISVADDGNIILTSGNIRLKIKTEDEFNNVHEVLANKIYDYYINNSKKDVIFDVGMNIGDAAVFFLQDENVEKVFGFEPFKQTFLCAQDNLKLYGGGYEIFQFGISNINEKRSIVYNMGMSCGQSSNVQINDKNYEQYQSWGLVNAQDNCIEEIEVKKASEVFGNILKQYIDYNMVLKMDCEGEEYGIIEDLFHNNLLDKFTFIMLEWHILGKEKILEYLKIAGFSYWCMDKTSEMGLIYAYNTNRNN